MADAPMRTSFLVMVCTAATAVLSCGLVRAEVFELTTGGTVEGTLQNPNEVPRITYLIHTPGGGELTLNREQVKEVRKPRSVEADYIKLRPQYPDTPEGQMKLADWCKERQLSEHRKRHLERVIELDPEHDKARAALGYAKIEGVWKTRDEVFKDRGFEKDAKGVFRPKIQIDELKRKADIKKAETDWFKKVDLWRGWLNTNRSEEALAQLQKINDPTAVAALSKRLEDEPTEAVRKIYVEALARIATHNAWRALTIFSLDDADEEIRQTCLDYLEKQPESGAVPIYIKRMRDKNATNLMINRAAAALQRMKDQSAVRPLVDSLVTVHLFPLATNTNNMNSTFGNGPGGGSFNFGGGKPQFEERTLQNVAVHDALVSLTGADYGYDQTLWKRWLATQTRSKPTVDARRD